MTLFIISVCLFGISIVLTFSCIFAEWDADIFLVFIISLIISGTSMIISARFVKPDIKTKEYPASEYDFKIKVVEFEEQRDTILVVIPKEENK